jgi:hypothetical protein
VAGLKRSGPIAVPAVVAEAVEKVAVVSASGMSVVRAKVTVVAHKLAAGATEAQANQQAAVVVRLDGATTANHKGDFDETRPLRKVATLPLTVLLSFFDTGTSFVRYGKFPAGIMRFS